MSSSVKVRASCIGTLVGLSKTPLRCLEKQMNDTRKAMLSCTRCSTPCLAQNKVQNPRGNGVTDGGNWGEGGGVLLVVHAVVVWPLTSEMGGGGVI